MRPLSAVLLSSLIAWLVMAGPLIRSAAAHAIIVDSSPKLDSTIKPGPVKALLTFNTRLELKGCRLTLIKPDGSRMALDTQAAGDNLLQTETGPLGAGAYRIDWIALSVDGHLTRGRIPFTVLP